MPGDLFYKSDGTLLGVIVDREIDNGELRLGINDSVVGDLSQAAVSDLCYGQKDLRVDGSDLRGYAFRVDLENSDTTRNELYSAGGSVFKSYR
jgi:hypothetical protein